MSRDSMEELLNRRKFLQMTGGAATIAVAGCSSNGDGSDGGDTPTPTPAGDVGVQTPTREEGTATATSSEGTETQGEPVEDTYRMPMDQASTGLHWNPYNLQNQSPIWTDFDPLVYYNQWDQEFEGWAASSWEFEDGGESLLVELRDGYEWLNGNTVTTEDYKINQQLTNYITGQNAEGSAEDQLFDEWMGPMEVIDDKSFRIPLKRPNVSETINQHMTLARANAFSVTDASTMMGAAPRHIFGSYLEDIQNASGDAQDEAIRSLITSKVEEPEGIGPYKIEEVRSENEILKVKRESGNPWLDRYPISNWLHTWVSNEQTIQAILNRRIDVYEQLRFPDNVDVPDDIEYVPSPHPNTFDSGQIHYNPNHDDWGKTNVRKAATYVIDMISAARSVPRTPIFTALSGLDQSRAHEEAYLDEVIDDFTMYHQGGGEVSFGPDMITQEEAEQRATELLESEGYTKDGNWWRRPDGSVFEVTIDFFSGWTASAVETQSAISDLRAFGIRAEGNGMESNSMLQDVVENPAPDAYEVCWTVCQYMQSSTFPHPLSAYNWYFNSAPAAEHVFWQDREIEVPMPIGDSDGSMETVNPTELTEQLATTTDPDEQKSIVEELAWTFNQAAISFPVDQAVKQNQYNTDNWQIPDPGGLTESGDVQMSAWAIETYGVPRYAMHKGHLQPKYE